MIEKIFGDSAIVRKGEGLDWPFPARELRIGHDWYLEKYQILSEAPAGAIVIDVGYNHGSWTGEANCIIPPGVFRIGIDPIDYNEPKDSVHHFVQCAIDDVDVRNPSVH